MDASQSVPEVEGSLTCRKKVMCERHPHDLSIPNGNSPVGRCAVHWDVGSFDCDAVSSANGVIAQDDSSIDQSGGRTLAYRLASQLGSLQAQILQPSSQLNDAISMQQPEHGGIDDGSGGDLDN